MGQGLHREGRAKKAEEFSFAMPVPDSAIAEEREKARELRASQWWQAQIASGRCHYCGKTFKPSELTMDHIIPVARGGKSDRHNVVPCCKQCNNEKKWLTPAEQILRQLGD